MTYHDALTYLDTLVNYERRHDARMMRAVTLARMERLCDAIGHPERTFRSIIVAGTNAKGSTCAMIYEMLRAANLHAGLYTSPHVQDLRERIRTTDNAAGNEWIKKREFASIVKQLQPAIEALADSPDGPVTFFEAVTAVAFLHFARRGVELAVLEVGLGGRLDATNVVQPAVAVIGPIGLDHMDVLGPNLAAIASEKAGIIKRGAIVISAAQRPEAASVIRDQAFAAGCPLIEYGQQINAEITAYAPRGLQLAIQGTRGRYEALELPLLGRHQAQNAALAVAAVEALSDTGQPHSPVQQGLRHVSWPGRCELLEGRPAIVLDGGHNPQAAASLKVMLDELWPGKRKHTVIGVSSDKSLRGVAEIIASFSSSVVCTTSRHPRACPPERLAQAFAANPGVPVTIVPDAFDACTYLVNTADPEDVIVVTGSLFLVGELRESLRRAQSLSARRRSSAVKGGR